MATARPAPRSKIAVTTSRDRRMRAHSLAASALLKTLSGMIVERVSLGASRIWCRASIDPLPLNCVLQNCFVGHCALVLLDSGKSREVSATRLANALDDQRHGYKRTANPYKKAAAAYCQEFAEFPEDEMTYVADQELLWRLTRTAVDCNYAVLQHPKIWANVMRIAEALLTRRSQGRLEVLSLIQDFPSCLRVVQSAEARVRRKMKTLH